MARGRALHHGERLLREDRRALPESEPIIYHATVRKEAWLENAFMNDDGEFDFSKGIVTPDEAKRIERSCC